MINKLAKIRDVSKNSHQRVKSFLKKYERLLMPFFLFLGFFIDTLTLTRVDQVFDNLVLITYLLLAGLSIYFFHHNNPNNKLKLFSPYVMQYAFGGLFSGLVIFYFKSSNFWISLPFLLILLALFVGNDFLHRKYQKLLFQISILYVGIFCYSILIVPIILRSIGNITFILGSILSLIIIFTLIKILRRKLDIDGKDLLKIKISIWSILILFNFFYLANIIPPVPLSLKTSFVAYNIEKRGQDYNAVVDKNPWYIFWDDFNSNMYLDQNEAAYVFTSVFAPNNFESTIYHEWSFFSSEKNRWIVTDRVPIQIQGGLNRGYRGYSYKTNLEPGDWKVTIKNKTNQTIGRIMFEIIPKNSKPTLTEITI